MNRRQGLLAFALVVAFATALALSLSAAGDWRSAMIMGAAEAAGAASGPGFVDKMTDTLIRDQPDRKEDGSPAFEVPAGVLPETGALPASAPSHEATAALSPSEAYDMAREAAAAAAAAAAEAEEQRLKLVHMKERSQGETRMYGGDASAAPRPRSGSMSEADIEASFGGMIQKLKGRAARDGAESGAAAAVGGGARTASGGGESGGEAGGDDPILAKENQSAKFDSPTLRALQRVNKDGRHSVGMSRDAETTDGSRDKAGKSFDGNRVDFSAIPIEERGGAMGRKHIRASPEAPPPAPEGQPVR